MNDKPNFKKMSKKELEYFLEENCQKIESASCSISLILDSKAAVELCKENADSAFTQISSIQSRLETKQKEIQDISSEIQKIKEEIEAYDNDIHKFHDKLFANTDESTECIQVQLDKLIDEMESLLANYKQQCEKHIAEQSEQFNTQVEKMETDRKTLFDKIEALLPSAISAGLASSYKEAQREIKSTKFLWFGFILVLSILFYCYTFTYKTEYSLGNILEHMVMGSPLIWLAWYFQRSISQKNRLSQDNHKQRVMNLYEGFVRAIDESGSEKTLC